MFSQGARIGIYCFGLNSKIWKLVNTRGVVKQSGRDGSVLNRSPQWSFYANPHPIRRVTAGNFVSDLHSAPWETVDTSFTVEEAWASLNNTIINIADKHAPTRIKRVRANTLPWITDEIRALIIQRNFHHKKAQKSGSNNEWQVYRSFRNLVTSRIRRTKKHYYSNLIEVNKTDSSKLWKTIKSIISTNVCSSQVESLVIDGENITDPASISARFGTFFSSITASLRQTLPSTPHPFLLHHPLGNPGPGVNFRLTSISEDFVHKQLRAINIMKSSGLENIPSRLLKDGADALVKPLTLLMNRTIYEGTIPSDWKHAVVTPVHKADPKTVPSHFRPISVLPVFSKILERAVHQMIYKYLQEHKLLSAHQSGFRPLHSTSTCLTHVTNTLLHNIDKGYLTGLVLLDLSKAFDTLDHNVMLDKLSDFGFNRSALQWFSSYLTGRTQSICVNGVTSEPMSIQFGVPQGSVLGPLLFIMYINDLPLAVRVCNVELYADDTLLFFASKSVRDIESQLTSDLENLISWFHSNFLILNVNKTKIMLIGTYQRLSAADGFSIRADNTDLDRVYAFKYLGVLMDQTLSWKDHIDSLGKKISSRLGMLRRARKVLPKATCVTLYNTMVLPLFDYCAAVWDGCGVGYKGYLDKLNRRAACIIEGRSVAADELFTVFSWPNLQARRDYLKCVLVYKSLRNLAPAYLLTEFKYAHQIHTYNTRHCDLLRFPLAKTAKYQGSFRFNGARAFNALPLKIRNAIDLKEFKIWTKHHLKCSMLS